MPRNDLSVAAWTSLCEQERRDYVSMFRRPTAIDLFSGCGGLTTGLKQAGFRVVAAIDSDDVSARTFRRNHRKCKVINKDITKVSPNELMSSLGLKQGELDLLAGCPPCQGFSALRNKNRRIYHHPLNKLVHEFDKFVSTFRPRAIMLENVPPLAAYGRFQKLVQFLTCEGYAVDHKVFDAVDFMVPQRRRRLILIAYRGDNPVEFCRPRGRVRTVRDAIGGLRLPDPSQPQDPAHDYKVDRSWSVRSRIQATPQDGGSRSDLGDGNQLECHRRMKGFKDVYGRIAWDKAAPTLTTGCINPSKGRFLHPSQHRAITVREAALLQSFPPSYWFDMEAGHYSAARLIGNAFPPRFAAAHARKIRLRLRDDGHLDIRRET